MRNKIIRAFITVLFFHVSMLGQQKIHVKDEKDIDHLFTKYFNAFDSLITKQKFGFKEDQNEFLQMFFSISNIDPKYIRTDYIGGIYKITSEELENWKDWYKKYKLKITPYKINRTFLLLDSINHPKSINIDKTIWWSNQLDSLSIK